MCNLSLESRTAYHVVPRNTKEESFFEVVSYKAFDLPEISTLSVLTSSTSLRPKGIFPAAGQKPRGFAKRRLLF